MFGEPRELVDNQFKISAAAAPPAMSTDDLAESNDHPSIQAKIAAQVKDADAESVKFHPAWSCSPKRLQIQLSLHAPTLLLSIETARLASATNLKNSARPPGVRPRSLRSAPSGNAIGSQRSPSTA